MIQVEKLSFIVNNTTRAITKTKSISALITISLLYFRHGRLIDITLRRMIALLFWRNLK